MDKRAAPRLAGISEAVLSTVEGEAIGRGSVDDLSESGLLVGYLPRLSVRSVSIGEVVRLAFVLPTGQVTGRAEVVRVDPQASGIALKIVSFDDDAASARLSTFVNSPLAGA